MIIRMLYIVYKRFMENKIGNLVLMFQIMIALFTLNLTIGSIHKILYISQIVESTKLDKAIYFSVSPWNAIGQDTTRIENRLKELNNIESIGRSSYAFCSLPDFNNVRLSIYNKVLTNSFSLPLSKGRWFADSDFKSGIAPAIISKTLSGKYKIGNIINLKVTGSTNKAHDIKVKVVGIFDNSNYILRLGAGGDNLLLSNIFERTPNFLIIPEGASSEINSCKPWDELGRVFFLNGNKELDKEFNTIKEKLKDIGYINKINDIKKQYQNITREDTFRQFILCFIILILALSGIGGSNALMQVFKEKEYAIFFACGMPWENSVFITILSNLIMLIIPSIATYLCLNLPSGWHLLDVLIFNYNNFLITIGMIIFIFIITSIDPLLVLLKTNPITIIRRWQQ